MGEGQLAADAARLVEDLFAAGDVAALKKQLVALELKHPGDVTLAVARARLSAAHADAESALKDLEALHRAHPSNPLVSGYLGAVQVGLHRYDSARPLLESAVAGGVDAPAIQHALGVTLLRAGDAQAALPLLRQAVEKMPASAPSAFFLGVAYAETRDWANAAESLVACIKVSPQYADAFDALARVHVEMGRMPLAQSTVEEGLKHNPGHPALSRLKVQLLADGGNNAGAEAAILTIPEAERTGEDWCNLALLALGRSSAVEARQLANAAVKAAPDFWRSHYLMGLALEVDAEVGRQKVVAAYRKAVELGDPDGEAGTRLGFVLASDGPHSNPQDAVEVLKAARVRSQDNAATLLHLAIALARLGNKPEAREAAEQARDAPTSTAVVREQVTRLLAQL